MLARRTFLRRAAALLPASTLTRLLPADDPLATAHPPLTRDQDRYLPTPRPTPNGTTTFKTSSADARNGFFAMEHHHTARGGPFLHKHAVEDEWFYVLEGTYRVQVGPTLYTLHPGDSILGPRGIPHSFAFVGPGTGRLLLTYAPAGRMEEFFSQQDQQQGGRTYTPDSSRLAAFGLTRLGPPLALD